MTITESKRILVSWNGRSDLSASHENAQADRGPVACAIATQDFNLAVLLSDFPERETTLYVEWIRRKSPCLIEFHVVELANPTKYDAISTIVVERIQAILACHGLSSKLTFLLSPGTPAMAAVWIVVAKTRFDAELIEASRQRGVQPVHIAFEV